MKGGINRVINMHGATAHVFRHSFATMLNDAGASVKTIQSIIGQSDFKTTADRYCHARDSSKQEAVRDLTALLTSNKSQKMKKCQRFQKRFCAREKAHDFSGQNPKSPVLPDFFSQYCLTGGSVFVN